MIRLARKGFFQHATPNCFCLIRKNFSESAAVKPESEVNKLQTQDDADKPLGTKFKKKITENLKSEDNFLIKNLMQEKQFGSGFHAFKPSGFNKIYDLHEAENLAKTLSPLQAIEAFKILMVSKTRPPLLLKCLSAKIMLGCHEFNFKNCTDVMYYSASLSFKNIDLLEALAKQILTFDNQNLPEKFVSSILHSCGKLKYRNCELIDFLLKSLLSQKSSNKSLLCGLMTLGTVNFLSVYGIVLMKELIKLSDEEFPLRKSYLDFVWACILINQFPVEHISKILSQEFFEFTKALYGLEYFSSIICFKLMNINAAATFLIPNYTGPKLDDKFFVDLLCKKSQIPFFSSVMDGLCHIFPKTGYLNTNVDTGAGFLLDIECYMDQQNEPVPLKNRKKGIKIGIMLIQFNDVCLGQPKTICGLTRYKEKIFEAQGYRVVQVFWDEYNSKSKLYDKVGYLREKLKKCIENVP